MPCNPHTRPAISLRMFSPPELAELRRMASERRQTITAVLTQRLEPLRDELRRRINARQTAGAS